MRKGNILTIAGFIISIILLYFSLKDIKYQEILLTLRKADFRFLFIPLVFIGVAVTLCSFRWSRITGSGVQFRDTFIALLIGLFVNNVLPARIGEVARAYVLTKRKGISFTFGFSTVLVDRFFDLAGLLLLTFIFFPGHSLPPAVSRGIYILVTLMIICIALIFVLSREKFANTIASGFHKIRRPLFSKLARRIMTIQENLKRISSPFNLLCFVAISFTTWFAMSTALYFAVLALGVHVEFVYIPFVCALLNMGLTIPSPPGYVGVYQALLVYLLSIFGVPKHEGFAVSIIYHAAWYIPYTIIGFTFLLKEHLKIKEIKNLEGDSKLEVG
ncbi:MAG: Phosphatidylglycerol lysyltransferase [Syntrophorhabdus sp. PtaU1.Bin153]|nr:MAG: Phosphatidylglycerol lysyltransferase [Syntrophorhabdus sp. PtaU1.Bin153]